MSYKICTCNDISISAFASSEPLHLIRLMGVSVPSLHTDSFSYIVKLKEWFKAVTHFTFRFENTCERIKRL